MRDGVIETEQEVAWLQELLACSDWVGVSGQLNATRAYRPHLSLLALNIGGTTVLIDPLAFREDRFDALAKLLAEMRRLRVVVHGGEYLLAAIWQRFHHVFPQVVDLQQAASLLGLPRTGLRALAAEVGLEVPAPVSVDWAARPLCPEALAHARSQVLPLGEIEAWLGGLVRAKDLTEEVALASQPESLSARVDMPDPRRYQQIAGASRLSVQGRALLAALVRWRDDKARELDVPPGRLLTNALLIELCLVPETAGQRVAQMRFHSRLVHTDLGELQGVIRRALAGAEGGGIPGQSGSDAAGGGGGGAWGDGRGLGLGRGKGPPSEEARQRMRVLKRWRQEEAARRGVGLQAVLPKKALEYMAYYPERPLGEVTWLGGRRQQRYGEQLEALLAGRKGPGGGGR